MTSSDYDSKSDTAQVFFQTIQNKMMFAVTGRTAAELIVARANAVQPNMGLTSWKGVRVRKGDVIVAKNYLGQEELSELNTTRAGLPGPALAPRGGDDFELRGYGLVVLSQP